MHRAPPSLLHIRIEIKRTRTRSYACKARPQHLLSPIKQAHTQKKRKELQRTTIQHINIFLRNIFATTPPF